MFIKISRLFDFKKDANEKVNLIVLGHQKTGTTAIASLLSKVSGETLSSDPLYMIDKGKGKAAKYAIEHREGINKICRKHPELFNTSIIKDPDFIFLYDDIKKCFPNAKMLFIVRDPRDTIRSICNRLKLTSDDINKFPGAIKQKAINKHWEYILTGKLPELTTADNDTSNFMKNLAVRWCAATDVYLNNSEEMLLVKYEQFRLDKENTIKELASQLDMPSDFSISEFVDIQYQPKGAADVVWETFFGKENLRIIEEICGKYLKLFDY